MRKSLKNHKASTRNNHHHRHRSYLVQQQYAELQEMQDQLDDLQSDRASMEIVFMSLKNAFLIHPTAELEEVDKEISRAYDDLMAQVRQLDRSLKKLAKSIKLTEKRALSASDSSF